MEQRSAIKSRLGKKEASIGRFPRCFHSLKRLLRVLPRQRDASDDRIPSEHMPRVGSGGELRNAKNVLSDYETILTN